MDVAWGGDEEAAWGVALTLADVDELEAEVGGLQRLRRLFRKSSMFVLLARTCPEYAHAFACVHSRNIFRS